MTHEIDLEKNRFFLFVPSVNAVAVVQSCILAFGASRALSLDGFDVGYV